MLDSLIKTANARSDVSSERIKNLGRRAAQRFIDSDSGSLTTAVSSVVQEEGDLSRDQIRRAAESANQAAWNALFVQGGETGTHFEPADADAVLSDAAPEMPEIRVHNTDYDSPPPAADIDPLLAAFDTSAPPPEYEALDPHSGTRMVHEKTAHAAQTMRSLAEEAYIGLSLQSDATYSLIKEAASAGEPFSTICKAVVFACEDREFAQDFLKVAAARLEADGIRINMQKVASTQVINPEHPMISSIADLEKNARAYVRASEVSDRLGDESAKALRSLRDKLRST
jgi:hypothetical protein